MSKRIASAAKAPSGTRFEELLRENEALRARLAEAEETLDAIRNGEVDAIVVSGADREQIYSLTSAETPYRKIIEEMNEGAATLAADGTILYCNRRFADLMDEPIERVIGSPIGRLAPAFAERLAALLQQARLGSRDTIVISPVGRRKAKRYLQLSLSPMPAGMPGDYCLVASDISELKNKEHLLREMHRSLEERVAERTAQLASINEALQRSNDLLNAALSAGSLAWWETDVESGTTVVHENKARMLGFPPDRFEGGMHFTDLVHPDDQARVAGVMEHHLAGKTERYEAAYRIRCSSGGYKWFHDMGRITSRTAGGTPMTVMGISMDITERKASEEELNRLFEQTQLDAAVKTDLLNEVNHRVKNNLMMILGLILSEERRAKKCGRADSTGIWEMFELRINGMLNVHQMLSDSHWKPMVLTELASRMMHVVFNAGMFAAPAVDFSIGESAAKVSPRQANNLALVFNEMTINSLKHAFVGSKAPMVKIDIRTEDDAICIDYRDNGPGFPEDVLINKRRSVGLNLIHQLVEESLGGSVQLMNDAGAVIRMRIGIEK